MKTKFSVVELGNEFLGINILLADSIQDISISILTITFQIAVTSLGNNTSISFTISLLRTLYSTLSFKIC